MSETTSLQKGQTLLETKGLFKSFKSGAETLNILTNLNLKLKCGYSLAILGASGSGKSTLMYLMGGLDKPSAGQVLSKGRDIFKFSENERAKWRSREVGFVFQFHYLLSEFDALENVSMPALLSGMTKAEAEALAAPLLHRVGLAKRLNHRPGALSGGEQQRVALARALVMSPTLLLADEPTGNLDASNASLVNELICQLVKERAICAVVVTHNSELAKMLDIRMELSGGLLHNWKQ